MFLSLQKLLFIVPFVSLILGAAFTVILRTKIPDIPYFQMDLGAFKINDFRNMPQIERKNISNYVIAFFLPLIILSTTLAIIGIYTGFTNSLIGLCTVFLLQAILMLITCTRLIKITYTLK